MEHDKTLARPYAKAAFEFALEQKALDAWSKVLMSLAVVSDPKIKAEELSQIFIKLAEKDEHIRNFILVLMHYDRLALLPEIAELFEEAKAEHEKISTVFVTSAFPMDEATQKKLKASLEIRLQREVMMDFVLDKNLLGGAIIRAGDWVVDGSVRAKLEKLKQAVIS